MTDQRRRRGRPAHQPTTDSRDLVMTLVTRGKSVAEIALAVGISEPTLRAHYAAELSAPKPQISFPLPEFAQPAPPRSAPDRAGRPPHIPTAETREKVEILLAAGMPVWQLAQAIGVSEPTLREYYAAELDGGRARRRADVLVAMHKAAVEGNVAAQKAYLSQDQALDNPPPPEPKAAPLGKKEAAQLAAETAGVGTDWQNLLPN